MSLERLSLRKLRSSLRPGPGGSSLPSLGSSPRAGSCAGSFSCLPRPGSACRPRRNARPTTSFHRRQVQHCTHERRGNVALQQPVAVLAEYGGHPHRIVHRQPDKPAGCNSTAPSTAAPSEWYGKLAAARPAATAPAGSKGAVLRVKPGKPPVERGQSVVGKAADQAKRVVFGDAAIRAHIAEQAVPSLVYAAHSKLPPAVDPRRDRIRYARVGARAFSAAC